ncbi:hypothetical protein [Nocardia carnea]|uniref:hypothetical protein n=1 Tax=Nocardia carnea TaxID=37328 RepID=UPI002456EF75|nr:hypothetical protein [Nocardia carnea]
MGNHTFRPQRGQKLPVTVEYTQWDGTAEGATPIIDWILSNDGAAAFHCASNEPCPGTASGSHVISIRTLEGTMQARPTDWVIRGVEGEFYPCADSIHRKTYRPAPAPTDVPEVLNITAEQAAAIRYANDTERVHREAWIAGFAFAEQMWSGQHGCCRPATPEQQGEWYDEWRAKNTEGQGQGR